MPNALRAVLLLALLGSLVRADDEGWIDLLAQLPEQPESVAGSWRMENGRLTVTATPGARLALPWKPTSAYTIETRFIRRSGTDSVAVIFAAGAGQATAELDAWRAHVAGIQSIAGQSLLQNPTRVDGIALTNGQSYHLVIHVRPGRVNVLLDGKALAGYQGDGSDLSVIPLWSMPNPRTIGLAAWDCDVEFSVIRVRPVDAAASSPAPLPATTPAVGPDDLTSLSDEFDDPATLSQWRRVKDVEHTDADQLQRLDISQTRPGWITMVPHASSWYQDYRGVLVHKPVTGDFVVTTRVRATGRSGQAPPRVSFSLAGIMIRTPREVTPQTWLPGQENYLFLSLGAARQPGVYAFEVKTTRDSNSQLEVTETTGPEALVRAARIGADFILLRREGDGPWVVHRRYHRPDMPTTLQVGMTVYTDYATVSRMTPAEHNRQTIRGGNPDLLASFDFFRFARPVVPAALRGRPLADPAAVSDADLLAFLAGS